MSVASARNGVRVHDNWDENEWLRCGDKVSVPLSVQKRRSNDRCAPKINLSDKLETATNAEYIGRYGLTVNPSLAVQLCKIRSAESPDLLRRIA